MCGATFWLPTHNDLWPRKSSAQLQCTYTPPYPATNSNILFYTPLSLVGCVHITSCYLCLLMDTPILINADVMPQYAGDSLPIAAKKSAESASTLSKHAAQVSSIHFDSAPVLGVRLRGCTTATGSVLSTNCLSVGAIFHLTVNGDYSKCASQHRYRHHKAPAACFAWLLLT